MGEQLLGKRVVAKWASGTPRGEGTVIGYCESPSVTIECDDGSRLHCRADLCEVTEPLSLATLCRRLIEHLDSFGGTLFPGEIDLDIRAMRAALVREDPEPP